VAQRWLDLVEVSAATRYDYTKNLSRYWMPRLAIRDVADAKKSEIRQIINDCALSSAKTRNNARTPCRGVFGLAVDDEMCPANPCDGIKYVKHQQPSLAQNHEEDEDLLSRAVQLPPYLRDTVDHGLGQSSVCSKAARPLSSNDSDSVLEVD